MSSIRVDQTSEKGQGVFALRTFQRSDLIISEKPLFTMKYSFGEDPCEFLAEKIRALDRDSQRQFFALSNTLKTEIKNPLLAIFTTNAIPMGADTLNAALYLTFSRFNHSCASNAAYCWNSAAKEERLYAMREIKAGEEITVSYIDEKMYCEARVQRRQAILQGFNFLCQCAACNVEDSSASDKRRIELGRSGMLTVQAFSFDPSRALSIVRNTLNLLAAEGHFGIMAQAVYYNASQVCVTHGDIARGVAFAMLAKQRRHECQGVDCDKLGVLERAIEEPTEHPMALITQRWLSRMSDRLAPDAEGFQEWLWERAS